MIPRRHLRRRVRILRLLALLTPLAASVGCTFVDYATLAGLVVEAASPDALPAAESPTHRILVLEGDSSPLTESLRSFATVTVGGDPTATDSYDAIVIDADALNGSTLREHIAVTSALAAGKTLVVAEPTLAHNNELIHALVGMSPNHQCVAFALDRLVDDDGRVHWAIIEAELPDDGDNQETQTAHAYQQFTIALQEWLTDEETALTARLALPVEASTAKARYTAQTSDGTGEVENVAPPAGAHYKHIFHYVAATRGTHLVATPTYGADRRLVRSNEVLAKAASLGNQIPSFTVKNHWYVYKNDGGDPDDDFGGIDCYVMLLHQAWAFSPGQTALSGPTEIGWLQDYLTVTTTPATWSTDNPDTLTPRPIDLNDTAPANVNNTTSETRYHETSISKSISVGISSDGLSGGASVTKTTTVGVSSTRDITDWGVLNLSDPGTSAAKWVFHQQLPFDDYGQPPTTSGKYSGNNIKQPPALSLGLNNQDTVAVWTTIGLDPDDSATNTYRVAFQTQSQQSLLALTHVNYILIGWKPVLFTAQNASMQDVRFELNDAFFASGE